MSPTLVALDTRVFRALYAAWGARLEGAAAFLSAIGGGWAMVLLVPVYGVARLRRLAATLTCALLATTTTVFVVKHLVGRSRPFLTLGGVLPLTAPPSDPSFPSGHASGSFTVAVFAVLVLRGLPAGRLGGRARLLLSTALLGLACSIAWSRVYLGVHYPGDVLAGATLGTVSGAVAARLYHRAAAQHRTESRPA